MKNLVQVNCQGLTVRFDLEFNEKRDGQQYLFAFIRPGSESSLFTIRNEMAQTLINWDRINLGRLTYVEVTDKEDVLSHPQAMRFMEVRYPDGRNVVQPKGKIYPVPREEVDRWRQQDSERPSTPDLATEDEAGERGAPRRLRDAGRFENGGRKREEFKNLVIQNGDGKQVCFDAILVTNDYDRQFVIATEREGGATALASARLPMAAEIQAIPGSDLRRLTYIECRTVRGDGVSAMCFAETATGRFEYEGAIQTGITEEELQHWIKAPPSMTPLKRPTAAGAAGKPSSKITDSSFSASSLPR